MLLASLVFGQLRIFSFVEYHKNKILIPENINEIGVILIAINNEIRK